MEDQFRREDDRRWIERIENLEARVVSLTSAQKTTDDDIDDLATKIADLEILLRGDMSTRDSGLVGQVNAIETELNSISRVFHPDAAGGKGIVGQLKELKAKLDGKERDLGAWLMFWAKVIGAIGSIAVVAVSSWPTISAYWKQTGKDMTTLNKKINRANHPRVQRYKPKPIEVPEEGDAKE